MKWFLTALFVFALFTIGYVLNEAPIQKNVHFISYGDEVFKKARERIQLESASSGWFKSVTVYSPEMIPEFFEKHHDFMSSNKRGGGYWIWKPYIIEQKLEELDEGEYLVYADAGCRLRFKGTKHLRRYLKALDQSDYGILAFQMDFIEKDWTKGDLAHYMGFDFSDPEMNSGQIMATVLVVKKTSHAIRFIKKWLEVAVEDNYHLVDDTPSKVKDAPSFVEHRHDQSIFSLLVKKEGGIIFADEIQFKGKDRKKNPHPFSAARRKD